MRTRWASWGFIAAALLMGSALLATIWSTRAHVRDVSETLARGQADIIEDGIRIRLAGLGQAPSAADLSAIVEDLESDGLRYLAAVDRRRGIVAEGGTPRTDRAVLASERVTRAAAPVPVDDRLRVVLGRRPRGRGPARDPARRATFYVFEVEPRAAAELRAASSRTLYIGALAAGGLLVAALLLVRWILHREALERRVEHGRRLAALGEMSAVLAHEIKNPLASLKGNAQLLARVIPEGDAARAKAERVVGEAVRLEQLTNDLLEFARSGALHRAAVAPGELVTEAASRAGDRVAVDLSRAPAAWSLDRGRMLQVLSNLLDNALASSDAVVSASAAEEGGHLVFVVRDQGPGIAPEHLPHVFEPFYTGRAQGTGLGLAVARRVVELHGGTIEAKNASGGGAELRISIPKA